MAIIKVKDRLTVAPKPKIRFIIGTGPNLIKASIDKDLGPDISSSILVGVQANDCNPILKDAPIDRVRITQLRMKGRPKLYPRGRFLPKRDYESIMVTMRFHGALASRSPEIELGPVDSWYKNWQPGQDWFYSGTLEFKDVVLVIELDQDPGPFILSILGKGIDRHIPYPRQELKLKEEDHSE